MNKKIYLLGLCVAASATIANAQQLPNVGFGDWKGTCGESINTAGEGSSYVRPGDEPTLWNGSSVLQKVPIFEELSFETVEKGTEDNDNYFVVLKNDNAMGNTMPAFISLSTPWVFVYGSDLSDMMKYASAGDGGSYGGIEFTNKPDAVSLKYRRTATEGEIAHVIAYLWNGTYKSNAPTSVSGSKPDFVYTYSREMENIDRVILGKQKEAETVIQQGKLIASCDYEINADTKDWEDLIVPLNYNEENLGETPDMVNVIISSADYWTRGNMKADSQLDVDDVDFVYYSTLTALEVYGETVELEEGKYEYAMSGSALPAVEKVVATTKSQFAEAAVTVDAENAQVRIVVTNQDGKDVDGKTSHTYVLQYEKIPAGVEGVNGEAVAVYGVAGAAAIDGYSGAIEVYAADGRLVKSVMVDGNAEIALDGGLYIVRAGGEAYKVFVK